MLNLSGIRNACGISQEKLAEIIGAKRETIAKIESGKSEPTPSTMQAIAKVLHIKNWWEVWTPDFAHVEWEGEAPI